MEIYCEHCNSEFTVSIKKSHHSVNRMHKIVICTNCGRKNFPSIKEQYNDKEKENHDLPSW
jgi:RNase P subunit RPR2